MTDRVRHYQFLPIDGGFEINEALEQISQDLDELASIVDGLAASYGEMLLLTPIAGPNITNAVQTLLQYDTVTLPGNGVTLDTTTGQFSFQKPGIYAVTIGIGFLHNVDGASARNTALRVFDATAASAVAGRQTVATSANANTSTGSMTRMLPVTDLMVGNLMQIEIGLGGTYTSVFWLTQALSIRNV